MTGEIKAQLHSHREVMELVETRLAERLAAAVDLVATALTEGNKLLVMGNGGSAGDAQHLAAEIVGRFKLERRGLPAIALTTDTSILTAIANDYGFEQVFRRQVEALAAPGDVVVGISTSGNSPNVLAALTLAREMGCRTVGLLGRDGGTIGPAVDLELTVPSQDTP
ncbi:MAG TPA: D-sedoheptulose 7-phosphate isomerase, partial [Geomobilimonas sp.]|nr:D-sedoheptulose 7-phosphate isomerase [Geomobilimonas sp.]